MKSDLCRRPTSRAVVKRFRQKLWMRAAWLAACMLATSSGTTMAQELAVPLKAQVCASCHGVGGNSHIAAIPNIAGQPKQFLVAALYMFREGKRKNDMMSPMAAGLSNADLNELATYFSSQKQEQPTVVLTAQQISAGAALTQQNHCIACHARDLGGQQHIPRLAGQHYDYIKAQLTSFHASTRYDMDGVMTSAAQALSENDIETLAVYVSGLTSIAPIAATPAPPPSK
ncbi:cytochrome c [Glaciimonas sp. PAMC28666]|uniref:c-type cytochrome n=1 Tax=Glaciimonas sp. PAMC28666 TaxID=2807626 RepID=UPI0019624CC2|nr:c-type cytochrome [Glaciimonas sp. PAMC28666]QRX81636.1 cytochrome c4 [Glaciimonas sp. PAMC28666]